MIPIKRPRGTTYKVQTNHSQPFNYTLPWKHFLFLSLNTTPFTDTKPYRFIIAEIV